MNGSMFFVVFLGVFLMAAPVAALDAPSTEQVIGLSIAGLQKGYPISFFREASLVNDTIGSLAVVVFFDRESDYAAAFFRLVMGEPLEFSRNAAAMIANDLTTSTRWDMSTGQAVGGSLLTMKLIPVPIKRTVLEEWMRKYPKSSIYDGVSGRR